MSATARRWGCSNSYTRSRGRSANGRGGVFGRFSPETSSPRTPAWTIFLRTPVLSQPRRSQPASRSWLPGIAVILRSGKGRTWHEEPDAHIDRGRGLRTGRLAEAARRGERHRSGFDRWGRAERCRNKDFGGRARTIRDRDPGNPPADSPNQRDRGDPQWPDGAGAGLERPRWEFFGAARIPAHLDPADERRHAAGHGGLA